ncbi:unnamed protein product [Sphacelaria rigidula]
MAVNRAATGAAAAAADNVGDASAVAAAAASNASTTEKTGTADDTAAAAAAAAALGGGGPTHLVVLVHGLAGTPEDLAYLKATVEKRSGPGMLVHLARCNLDKTKDGVAEGGTRLAKEVLGLVESTPSLSRISLVGNSLGGLYVRYAAKLLYREDGVGGDAAPSQNVTGRGGTVAGLTPTVFMTIATPHLGLRHFFYVPLPLQGLARGVIGRTGSDLFLTDRSRNAPVQQQKRAPTTSVSSPDFRVGNVSAMSAGRAASLGPGSILETGDGGGRLAPAGAGIGDSPAATEILDQETVVGDGVSRKAQSNRNSEMPLLYDMATSEDFLKPLKAFSIRRAYANRRGDFLVHYGTAAFLEPNEEGTAGAPGRGGGASGESDGATGASTSMGLLGRLLGTKQGLIVGSWRLPPGAGVHAREGRRNDRAGLENAEPSAAVTTTADEGVHAKNTAILDGVPGVLQDGGKKMEQEMAAGLNSCGWQKVAVDFGGLLPFSHNKICALSRTPFQEALYSAGKNIMDHAAELLAGRFDENDSDIVNPVDGPPENRN